VRLYFRHLKPDGVLAPHLSNNHLALIPVAEALARTLNMQAVLVDSAPFETDEIFGAKWVLVSPEPLRMPDVTEASQELWVRPGPGVWTDDYSNLFQILK